MLLFVDGCLGGDLVQKWDSGSSGTRTVASPRFTGGGYYTSGTATKTIPASGELFVGAAFYWPAGSHTLFSVYGDGGATQHITITRNSSLKLEVRRGSATGTVLATGATNLSNTTWIHVEVRVIVDDTAGVVQVRLNGSTSFEVNFTGDTRNGGTSTNLDRVTVTATNSSTRYTDVQIGNSASAGTWLGDNTVATLVPAVNGTYVEGTPNPSGTAFADRYTLVRDLPFVNTTGMYTPYNGRTIFGLTALPAGGALVRGLQVNHRLIGATASVQMRRMIRSAGVDYYGAPFTVPTSYDVYSEVLQTDPATGAAWDPDVVNTLQAGIAGSGAPPTLDGFMADMTVEALIESVPSTLVVKVAGGGGITVDTPNIVNVIGGGGITVVVAGQVVALVPVDGGGAVAVSAMASGFPRPEPADVTLMPQQDDEDVVLVDAEDFPEPTLVDGVPIDWEPL